MEKRARMKTRNERRADRRKELKEGKRKGGEKKDRGEIQRGRNE